MGRVRVAVLGFSITLRGPDFYKMGNIGGIIVLKDLAGKLQRVHHNGLAEPPFSDTNIKNNTFLAHARTQP